MNEMNLCGMPKPVTEDDLKDKKIELPLEVYARLLDDNSMLTSLKNALSEGSLKDRIGDYRQRNREEAMTRWREQQKVVVAPRFEPGDPVLFAFMYGHGSASSYNGEPRLGFVQKTEFVEAQNSFLYHLVMENPNFKNSVSFIVVGQHMVFGLSEEADCLATIEQLKGRN